MSRKNQDAGLAIVKATQGVTKGQSIFVAAVAKWTDTYEGLMLDLDTRIASKKRQFDDIDLQYEQSNKARKIEVDHDVKEYGYSAACDILERRGEVPISRAELDKLRANLAAAETQRVQEVKAVAQHEKETAKRSHGYMERQLKLQNDVQNAALVASNKQHEQHITVLKAQIQSQQSEIAKQRELTASVADASRPAPQGHPQYIPSK